ncbi:MAG: hypothetical protein AB1540_04260 [Bdellovibrionota bacterium]
MKKLIVGGGLVGLVAIALFWDRQGGSVDAAGLVTQALVNQGKAEQGLRLGLEPSSIFLNPAIEPKTRSSISHFSLSKKKALKTLEEKQGYESMLADENLIQQAKEILLDRSAIELDEAAEGSRIESISYLYEVVRSESNPVREKALSAIEQVVMNPLPTEERKDSDLSKSLQGDVIELFAILAVESGERAQRVIEQVTDLRLQEVYRKALLRQLATLEQ